MQNSNKELQLLYKISQTISSRQQNISELLNEVLKILENEMGALRGTLTLRKPGSDILNIEASSGLSNKEKETSLFSGRFLKISLSFLAGTVNLTC